LFTNQLIGWRQVGYGISEINLAPSTDAPAIQRAFHLLCGFEDAPWGLKAARGAVRIGANRQGDVYKKPKIVLMSGVKNGNW
jgi:hypothetical protein